MNTILITLTGNPLEIDVRGDQKSIGSQFDNFAAKFIFKRPDDYENDALLLFFSDGQTNFAPINIGEKNEFDISNYLTQTTILKMQVAFERDQIIIAHSNIRMFFLRESIQTGDITIESHPESIPRLLDKAVTKIDYENSWLTFQNFAGETVDSIQISGHSPFIGDNGNWREWSDEASDYVDTGIFTKGGQGEPGLPGDKGEPGSPGVKGDKGDKGDTGEPGLPGVKGDKGDKGDTGEPGLPGDKGDKGDTGEPGLPGVKGDKGDKGEPGETPNIESIEAEIRWLKEGKADADHLGDPDAHSALFIKKADKDGILQANLNAEMWGGLKIESLFGRIFTPTMLLDPANLNDYTTPGLIGLSQPTTTNNPNTTNYFYIVNFTYSTNRTQVAIGYTGNQIAFRSRYQGNWSAWRIL